MKSKAFALGLFATLSAASSAHAAEAVKIATKKYNCYGYITDRTNEGFVNFESRTVALARGDKTQQVIIGENLGLQLVVGRDKNELSLSAQYQTERGVGSKGFAVADTDAEKVIFLDVNEGSIISGTCEAL
ncbi:MAG TPA: hypothetical protein VM901_00950 [Bdellovibrionota bacterium]|jgi:hypothetical protein|nr:hypothetical protein [Bdellovibrionota bacterium]